LQDLATKVSAVKERFATAAVVNTLFKTILKEGPNNMVTYCGNDTECALLIMSKEFGHDYEKVRTTYPEGQVGRKGFSFSVYLVCRVGLL